MSTVAESGQGMGWRARDALGQTCGRVAGSAALVLLWVFAITSGARGRLWSPVDRRER